MEAMKMNVLLMIVMVVSIVMSGLQNVSAMDAPAPAPASDASIFLPTGFASLVALAFGFFF
ncbi:unnamed protein product [Withania somnifera]